MNGKVWDSSQCPKIDLLSLRLIRVAVSVVNEGCEIVNVPYMVPR